MSAKSVSPESVSSAPITNPKNLGEYEQMLRINSTNISQADYDTIYARLNIQKDLLGDYASKGDGLVKHMTQMYIKEQMAAFKSAMNLEKAKKVKEKTDHIQAPAIAAAQNGDKKAVAALQEVVIQTQTIDQKKMAETQAIKAEIPPKVATLNTEVQADKILRGIRSKFDNRLNFNDALILVLNHSDSLAKFTQNDAYFSSGAKESVFTKYLDQNGYLARSRFGNGENNYMNTELLAILELRDSLKNDPKIAILLKNTTRIQSSVRINESLRTKNSTQAMLAELLDFNNDNTLTSYNQKDRSSNVLVGAFQKLLDLGKDTQMVKAPELMAYQVLSSQVKNENDVYTLIGKRLRKTPEEVQALWSDSQKKPLLIEQFRRAYLLEVTQSNTTIASQIDATSDIARYQSEKVREQANQLRKIKDKLSSEGMERRVTQELKKAGLPSLDGSSMQALLEQTAIRIYEINPQIFSSIGVHTAVNENILQTKTDTYQQHTATTQTDTHHIETQTIQTIIRDIRVTQDASGNEISRVVTGERNGGATMQTVDRGTTSSTSSSSTKTFTGSSTKETKTRDTRINPTLVIGLHQDVFGYKSERFNTQTGAGISAVAGVDGIIFPISASVSGNFTASNSNASIQSSKLEGNFILGARLSISKPLNGNSDTVPSIGFDINPNDRLNTLEKQQVRLEALLEKITIKTDGTLDTSKLETELITKEKEANTKDPKDLHMLSEIALMRKFLADTAKVLGTLSHGESQENIGEQRLLMIKNNMQAYKNAYKEAILMNNQGYSIAGVNITFIPGISAVFLGLNIQNIVAKAKKIGRDPIEARLTGKPMTLAEVNRLYPETLRVDSQDMSALIVKGTAIKEGNILIREITQTQLEGDKIKLIPQEGFRLRFQNMENITGEGITTHGIIIDQVTVEKIQSTVQKVTPSRTENVTKIAEVYNSEEYTKKEKDLLFVLSRTNTYLISALNNIIAGKYSDAKAQILLGRADLNFIATKIGDGTSTTSKNALDNLILATSGSRSIRESSNLTYEQMIKEQKKNESAFMKLLPRELTPGSKGVYKNIQNELNSGSAPKTKVELAPLSTLVGSGYRDIAGTVSFSQIGTVGGKNQKTLAGLFRFSGDMQVFGKKVELQELELKNMILMEAEKSGIFQKNLDATNTFLQKESIRKLNAPEYRSYLMGEKLPEPHQSLLDTSVKPKFIATRAALPGSTCFNDVFAIAFPLMNIKGKTQETMVTALGDRSPIGSSVNTSDLYQQYGGGSTGTFGIDLSRTITQAVTEKVVTEVTETAEKVVVDTTIPTSTTTTVPEDHITIVKDPIDPNQGNSGISTNLGGGNYIPGDGSSPVTGTTHPLDSGTPLNGPDIPVPDTAPGILG